MKHGQSNSLLDQAYCINPTTFKVKSWAQFLVAENSHHATGGMGQGFPNLSFLRAGHRAPLTPGSNMVVQFSLGHCHFVTCSSRWSASFVLFSSSMSCRSSSYSESELSTSWKTGTRVRGQDRPTGMGRMRLFTIMEMYGTKHGIYLPDHGK